MSITALAPGWQSAERPDAPWTRIVVPTRVEHHNGNRIYPVFVTIKWDGKCLSITGTEGPNSDGNAYGACGQIKLNPDYPAEGWGSEDVRALQDVWDRWHLNNMRSGSPAQEEWLRTRPRLRSYNEKCEVLAYQGLDPDPDHDDYKYGSAWLHEDVPDNVLDYLWGLPNTTLAHPWGRAG